jgi:hypothetical protein
MSQKPIILLGQPLIKKHPSILDSDLFPAIYSNGEGNGSNGHDKPNGKAPNGTSNRQKTADLCRR